MSYHAIGSGAAAAILLVASSQHIRSVDCELAKHAETRRQTQQRH
jgi:hypothetical protein